MENDSIESFFSSCRRTELEVLNKGTGPVLMICQEDEKDFEACIELKPEQIHWLMETLMLWSKEGKLP